MKKILIITWCHPKKWSWVEKVAYEMASELSKYHKVTFIYLWDKNLEEKEGNIIFIWKKTIRTYIFDWLVFGFIINSFLKKNSFDLIIDNHWVNIFNNKKTINIAHWVNIAFYKKVKFKSFIEKIKYYLFFLFINWLVVKIWLKKAYKIITATNWIKDELIEYYNIDKDKIKIISNWCDKNNFDIETKNFTEKLKIIFVSNDHIRKWIDILEKVAKYFENNENIEFNIVWREYSSKINNLNYLGKLAREKVYEEMWKSHIIFLPSYYEWQALVVIESMNLGCIPLISKYCHADYLENTKLENFISEENTPDFYINKINYILENKQNLKELSTLSKSIVNEMNWDKINKQYLEYINECLD